MICRRRRAFGVVGFGVARERGRDTAHPGWHVSLPCRACGQPTRGGSAPPVVSNRTRGIRHQLLQETLSLFPECVEMLDVTFDSPRSGKLVHWLQLHLC